MSVAFLSLSDLRNEVCVLPDDGVVGAGYTVMSAAGTSCDTRSCGDMTFYVCDNRLMAPLYLHVPLTENVAL